ncbi:MAG: ABC transporter permease subunit [Cellulomonas sp.]|jgi:hypothetical protein|nr:ABC transporter permease subunit [Cellulomonas sp.]
MMAWIHGLTTVVGLELRQRVRSRRWWVSLVAWFVLIGAFTLLMRANVADSSAPPEPLCDSAIIGTDDGTTVAGCDLTSTTNLSSVYSDQVMFAQTVCTADEDGTVRCAVMSWFTPDGLDCWDTGDGPACSRYDPMNGLQRDLEGPPQPDLGIECTNTADGSAVCHLPAGKSDGALVDPPQTCTVRYDPSQTADLSVSCAWDPVDGWVPSSGPMTFGFVVIFVLGLGLLVAPALTAGSINGDRQAGTLATLQATTLSATQIALGKLVAAWLTVAAFLVAALPWMITATTASALSPTQVLGACALLMLELAVMCAVGLGWSALFNRTSGSNLASYGTALTLSVLTVVFTVLLVPLSARDTQVEVWGLHGDVQARWEAEQAAFSADPTAMTPPTPPFDECTWTTETRRENRTETIWWLLVPNPFVMVADAAPEPKVASTHPDMYRLWGEDPLFAARDEVAVLAAGPAPQVDECKNLGYVRSSTSSPVEPRELTQVRVWPWSLAANLLLGGTFFAIAVRRLRVPYRKLPRGTRVA